MRKSNNNSQLRLALAIMLSVLLLFVQSFKLHLHVQQEGVPVEVTEIGSKLVIHQASYLHDAGLSGDLEGDLNPAEINILPESVVKKVNFFNPLAFLLFLAILFWRVPQLRCFVRKPDLKTERQPLDYLTHQPLRAPPASA
ncbi:MAG: hypothetical protein OQK73_00750 [Gammaproteobacteria bacterium]|nr:hypothetical protein [Gammaproteobacteria bacterium]